jgi:hypothetical protein
MRWLREHPAVGTAFAVIVALVLAVLIVLAVASDLSTAGSPPTTKVPWAQAPPSDESRSGSFDTDGVSVVG